MTPYHRQGGLNNRHLFLAVLEAWQAKIKVQPGWIRGGSSWTADSHLLTLDSHGGDEKL